MMIDVACTDLAVGWRGLACCRANLSVKFEDLNGVLPIMGRTGYGKSTLLWGLAGLSRILEGRVSWRIGDEALYTWNASNRSEAVIAGRSKFGFMAQNAQMLPYLTVEEWLRVNLRLRGVGGSIPHLSDMAKKALRKVLIEDESVDDIFSRYPSKLSGGQRHRVALAVALAHNPAVLFADEPTGSLDDQTRHDVLRKIRAWLDESPGRRAFVFVTHHRDEAGLLGCRLALELQRGELKNLTYARLCEASC